jgi:hypothetical protein
VITDNLRRLESVSARLLRAGAFCRNPERFSAKDLYAISVQRSAQPQGLKPDQAGHGCGTAKAMPFHEPRSAVAAEFQRA